MKLVMFTPIESHLDRGWPGRLDGDDVVQLAAQTLQAFFTGGGQAREHARYPISDIAFLAPVLHPPSVRIYDGNDEDFRFANPAAIVVPGLQTEDDPPPGATYVIAVQRSAGIIGAEGAIGGFTDFVEWMAPELAGEKARDFALALGPVVTTADEGAPAGVDWERLVAHAAENTTLYPGDLIVR